MNTDFTESVAEDGQSQITESVAEDGQSQITESIAEDVQSQITESVAEDGQSHITESVAEDGQSHITKSPTRAKLLCEFFKNYDVTICGLPLPAALAVFNSDGWFATIPATTYRGVNWAIYGTNFEVNWCRQPDEDYNPIDVGAVHALGSPRNVTIDQLLESQGLFNAMLFSVVRNKEVMMHFARWYTKLNRAQKNIVRLAPRAIKAVRAHIAWLQASCDKCDLNQASWDLVTKTVGLEHTFPEQSDVDAFVMTDTQPAYVSRYLALWEPEHHAEHPAELFRDMSTDANRFEVFTAFLDTYTGPEFW